MTGKRACAGSQRISAGCSGACGTGSRRGDEPQLEGLARVELGRIGERQTIEDVDVSAAAVAENLVEGHDALPRGDELRNLIVEGGLKSLFGLEASLAGEHLVRISEVSGN